MTKVNNYFVVEIFFDDLTTHFLQHCFYNILLKNSNAFSNLHFLNKSNENSHDQSNYNKSRQCIKDFKKVLILKIIRFENLNFSKV